MIKKVRRRVRFWSLKVIGPFLPVLLIIALVVALAQAKLFNVREIDCQLDNYPCSLVFEPLLVTIHGQNIFTLKNQTIGENLKNLDPSINTVEISQSLPDKLVIVMKRKPAVARVAVVDNPEATNSATPAKADWQLDEAGNMFALSSPAEASLPLVLVASAENLDGGIGPTSVKLAQIIQALNGFYVHWTGLAWVSAELVVIETALGPEAIINPAQPIEKTIATLQYILANLKIGEKLPNKIDLRFDQPVLSY